MMKRIMACLLSALIISGIHTVPVTQASTETELLQNPGFEGTYGSIAPNWNDNSFGGASVSYSRETEIVHSGGSSQKLQINSLGTGTVLFYQSYNFLKYHKYQADIWLRASSSMKVTVSFRQSGSPYETFGVKTVTVGTSWTPVSIKAAFPGDINGRVQIAPLQTGTLYVDDAGLTDITPIGPITPINSTVAIPRSLFGMHVNKLGVHYNWPAVKPGTIRLWDTGTKWSDIEPNDNDWKWDRFDLYVNYILGNNPAAQIIYTLGQTPLWAAARTNETCAYSTGRCSEPANMNDWIDYLQHVGTRYKGKIKFFEVWNEANYKPFYTGNVATMVQMTQIARDTLKAIDPEIQIISPGLTSAGMSWLNDYLEAGGGSYADIVGFHAYFTKFTPEAVMPLMDNVQEVMTAYGIGDKKLFVTEGSANTNGMIPTDDQAMGAVARAYILYWAHNVREFDWYMWDESSGNRVKLSGSDYKTLTKAGTAYRETAGWLEGSQLTSYYRDNDGTYMVELRRSDGSNARIVWNETASLTFNVPSNWGANQIYSLDGTATNIASGDSVPIGFAPKMFVRIDQTPPVTTSVLFPQRPGGANGWYISDVTLRLAAADDQSGVTQTVYRINHGDWNRYQEPLTFGEGMFTVDYRSTDRAGNVEETKAVSFQIDKTAPELNIQLDTTTLTPANHKLVTIHASLEPSDLLSGVASVALTSIISSEPDRDKAPLEDDIQNASWGTSDTTFDLRAERNGNGTGRVYTITYRVTDIAGNQSDVNAIVTVPHDSSNSG